MKEIKRIFKRHVSFYLNEINGTTVVVCEDVGDVLYEIGSYLEDLFGFYPPIKIKSYANYKISVKVVCQPEDKWDEEYGRRLAFNKLYRRQFKSILNNVFGNSLNRIRNVDHTLCKVLGRPTMEDMFDTELVEVSKYVAEHVDAMQD